MLGLTLREEFRGRRLKGTASELSNDTNTGATRIAAREFLEITYPTHDLLKAIEAVGPLDFGRILWGEAPEYPQEILLREGGKPVGLFHLRIT